MPGRIITEILTYSQETKTLIGIRKHNSDDGVWVGYILDFNETVFMLQHVSPLGFEDGIIIERIDVIDNFETDDPYLRATQLLFEQENQILKQTVTTLETPTEENWQLNLIKNVFDLGKIISVEVNNADAVNYGFILDYDDSSLQLKSITKIGEENGTETYCLADITSLSVDRIEARKRQFLYEMNKKKRNRSKK